MLKALVDLERAVGRLVEKAGEKAPEGSDSRSAAEPVVKPVLGKAGGGPDRINEEAAELIRRAIKRLRSL